MPIVDGKYRRPQLRNRRINYRHGWFFVTLQVLRNKSVLGAIVGEECVLNALGEAVKKLIETLHDFNPEVYVDCFVVMPNHVHLVLKIEDRPTNDEHHLGKIVRKLKSLAAREYRILAGEGKVPPIIARGATPSQPENGRGATPSHPENGRGATPSQPNISRLWQENYWEKIITNRRQLEAIRHYIEENPKCWSIDRFGPVTSYSVGDIALLDEPFEAFVASQDARGDALAVREWMRGATPSQPENGRGATPSQPENGRGATPSHPENDILGSGTVVPRDKPVIISTFTSPQEREVLRRLVADGRRFISVYPGGIPPRLPRSIADSVKSGRALLLSPVEGGTGVNKQRAVWCNEYVIKRAARVWCGHVSPGGTLHSILRAAGLAAPVREVVV